MSAPDPFEQAADWLEDVAEWSPARRAAFLDWLAQDPAHLRAARRVAQVMDDASVAQALAACLPFPANDTQTEDSPKTGNTRRGDWRMPLGIAAAAASLAIALLGLAPQFALWQDADSAHFATEPGQDTTSRLADGSTVHLDPSTTLDVALSAKARSLKLAQGRALFDVAHAPERPFTVESGPMAVTAIGTVFSVDASPAGRSLRVEQGRVRVAIAGEAPIMVAAGHGVILRDGAGPQAFAFHPDPALAADPQWLVVDGERLDMLVSRLQRHAPMPLTLAPELAASPITGRYPSHDPLASLRLIALAHGWQVRPDGAGWRMAR